MDKKTVIQMLKTDFRRIHEESEEIAKTVHNMKQESLDYINALLVQIASAGTASLLAKTPKIPKKRTTRIKAIPENDISDDGNSLCNSRSTRSSRLNNVTSETLEITTGRTKREASIKAIDVIKKQQAVSLNSKLRRLSNEESDLPLANRIAKENRSKRPKDLNSSEDEDTRPTKQSKITKTDSQSKLNEETYNAIENSLQISKVNETHNQGKQNRASVKRKLDDHNEDFNATLTSEQSTRQNSFTNDEPSAKKANYSKFSPEKQHTDKEKTISIENKNITKNTRSSSLINTQSSKKGNNIINETLDMSNVNETMASMYEDAIGKPFPIMNSTMKPNTTVTLDKIMNVTVSLERFSSKKVCDENVTVNKTSVKDSLLHLNNTMKKNIIEEKVTVDKSTVQSVKLKQESKIPTILKSQRDEKLGKFDELITDDESSPERKEYIVEKEKMLKQQKRITRSNTSMTSDEDEVLRTPVRIVKNLMNKDLKGSTLKSGYKQAALFSPYTKESVRKRVQAFEQVTICPKESETATRVTRTKTRALAAADFTEPPALTVSQKLARKSLAKAKKISLAKHAKDDDTKENENANIIKSTKSSSTEKSAQKPSGKTTPLGKTRIQMPSSVTKNTYTTPSNSQYYSKTVPGSRGNIVTHVDSFIQSTNTSASKQIDRAAEEKRRRMHEEDARRKREELLKAQAEEKKRKREEKELKNKLAREAKERQEYEKRLKAEREREEKAKLAQQMQEKQKEEMEKKRIAQLQRAQEKEERKRQEEYVRLQRLQEQEEQERLLAEQKRRELEMEKRKQMAEMKLKNQMEKAMLLSKAKLQKQALCNYKMDSDPDEEESEDENKPKHPIPYWASKNARQPQLAMQQHIPLRTVLRFFDAKKCTPDLRELFQGIDPRKLKRSSSAIWKTPPRYSMMNYSIIKD